MFEQRVAHANQLDNILLAVSSIALCFVSSFFADLAYIVDYPAEELRFATAFYLVILAVQLKLNANGHVFAVDLVDEVVALDVSQRFAIQPIADSLQDSALADAITRPVATKIEIVSQHQC